MDELEQIKVRRAAFTDDHTCLGLNWLSSIDWLVGEVERLDYLLARLEWADRDDLGQGCCPVCERFERAGHAADCWLAEELGR